MDIETVLSESHWEYDVTIHFIDGSWTTSSNCLDNKIRDNKSNALNSISLDLQTEKVEVVKNETSDWAMSTSSDKEQWFRNLFVNVMFNLTQNVVSVHL